MTGDLAPASICAMGGRFAVDDDRTIPDTHGSRRSSSPPAGWSSSASTRPAATRRWPQRRHRAPRHAGHRSTSTSSGFEIVPERGGQFQDRRAWPIGAEAVKVSRRRRSHRAPPCTRGTSSTASSRARSPTPTSRSATARPRFSLLANISLAVGQAAGMGRRGGTDHQQRRGQRAAALRVPQAVDSGIDPHGTHYLTASRPVAAAAGCSDLGCHRLG